MAAVPFLLHLLRTRPSQSLQNGIEEYGALNTYNAAIDQLGNIYLFSQIARSEQQHVDALSRFFTKYNLDVPANPGLAAPLTFEGVTDACRN